MSFNYDLEEASLCQFNKIKILEEQKNNAYNERNRLVALLSKIFPSALGQHDPEDKELDQDWLNIVFITLPTGQCSWHIHDSELYLFSHLKLDKNIKWDGHSTDEKYKRIENYTDIFYKVRIYNSDGE